MLLELLFVVVVAVDSLESSAAQPLSTNAPTARADTNSVAFFINSPFKKLSALSLRSEVIRRFSQS